jgi:hypothetical protein
VEEAERGEVVGLVGVSADSFLWMRGRGRSAVGLGRASASGVFPVVGDRFALLQRLTFWLAPQKVSKKCAAVRRRGNSGQEPVSAFRCPDGMSVEADSVGLRFGA